MAQQTAVDYLVEKLNQCEPFYSCIVSLEHKQHIDGLIEQAKAMEKEQIEEAFISGGYAGLHFPLTKDAFYKEYLEDKFSEYHNTNYNNGL
jgi:hypothetical protein